MPSRRAALLPVLLLASLLAPGLDRERSVAAAAPVETILRTLVADLGPPPMAITASRVVFTPGAAESPQVMQGLRLVVVEAGSLTLSASHRIEVSHASLGKPTVSTAVPAPTPRPTPTPQGSATPDRFLDPGDAFPVPEQVMDALRNDANAPAAILDLRITSGRPSLPQPGLDAEPLSAAVGLTNLPTGSVAVTLGYAALAAGTALPAPAKDTYQLAFPRAGGGDRLLSQADGGVRNAGAAALDVYVLSIAPSSAVPRQPLQPATGPGGADVAFDRVVANHYGAPGQEYWLFEPAGPHAAPGDPDTAAPFPVILFLSGCCADPPLMDSCPADCHQAWIDHLVRRGAIVVFPLYRGDHAETDVTAAIHAAVAEIRRPGHAPPDFGRVALFGWSFGGMLGANYAAAAAKAGLPVPKAVMLDAPGCEGCKLADLSQIAPATRVLVLVGSDDDMAGEGGARRIWAGLTAVPADRRGYVRLMGDRHGEPPLVTDHLTATTTQEWNTLDALDWYGLWKPFDALMACTFAGRWCEDAFGNTPEERFMGVWSDGVPVAEARVVADPGPPSATPTG